MWPVQRSSLSHKLTLMSVWSTGSALTLVFVAYAATAVLSHTADQRQQLSSLAGVIGTNSVNALLFADPRQAEQTLAALGAKDDVAQAALFDRDGKRYAQYTAAGAAGSAGSAGAGADLGPARLAEIGAGAVTERCGPPWAPGMRVYRPVLVNGNLIGAVMIEAGLGRMWRDVLQTLAACAAASLVSLAIALVLAARFKRGIAEPIGKLIAAARLVSTSQTYQQRVAHQRDDELGTLIDSFNDMLSQLDSHDARLAQYRDQLERQVSVRTEQLEKAKNAAEAASHAKSAFLATMSHEIRTPMNGVLGMTELLLATPLSGQQRHYTDMVRRSGQHLLVIINDILDFSKIEAGKLTVEYIHFNFRELLDDIDHVFAPQARLKGLALEFSIAPDIPLAICGDPNRLRQVIVNLLGNAIKFTDRGQITVKVGVTAEDAQAVSLRCEVHDSGIGVDHDAQARIFDSFSQADGSTTRKHGGTGLGLSISKQLVELMGGTIGVDNALTQGSVFWFAVNFDKRRVDVDDPGFNYTITQGLRALIVDQHTDSRALLERQLAGWKISADSAADAADALGRLHAAAADGRPYDVALLDMALARTSGLALASTIKADAAIDGVKLLLSSVRDAADSVQRRQAGVAFQLIQPARECDLYECLITPARPAAAPPHAQPAPAR
ncbi:ATP-binding protein, partial [Rugamonas sp.]|uniref:ATP-binding protein n=1 Tax=Rugamonas sp. TaxID=1926287 RepID=UPI0025D82985